MADDKISRTLLRERILGTIRTAILDGTLQPGERLRDDELTAWLGTSRAPIREALDQLADLGVVEMSPNRFTKVAAMSPRLYAESAAVWSTPRHARHALGHPGVSRRRSCPLLEALNAELAERRPERLPARARPRSTASSARSSKHCDNQVLLESIRAHDPCSHSGVNRFKGFRWTPRRSTPSSSSSSVAAATTTSTGFEADMRVFLDGPMTSFIARVSGSTTATSTSKGPTVPVPSVRCTPPRLPTRRLLTDDVFDRLRDDIVRGPARARRSASHDQELAARLGLSRATVRTALLRLATSAWSRRCRTSTRASRRSASAGTSTTQDTAWALYLFAVRFGTPVLTTTRSTALQAWVDAARRPRRRSRARRSSTARRERLLPACSVDTSDNRPLDRALARLRPHLQRVIGLYSHLLPARETIDTALRRRSSTAAAAATPKPPPARDARPDDGPARASTRGCASCPSSRRLGGSPSGRNAGRPAAAESTRRPSCDGRFVYPCDELPSTGSARLG